MPQKSPPALRPGGLHPAEAMLLLILFGLLAAVFLQRNDFRALAQGRRERARPVGSISGTVVGSDVKPAAGARVMVQTSDGRTPRTARTDANGHFRVKGLRVGPYDLRARVDGAWSDWTRDVRVRANQESSVKLRIPATAAAPSKKSSPAKSPPASDESSKPHAAP